MPEKVDFKNYDQILDNFDAFCDEFESRATESYQRGDQNDGRVQQAAAESGEGTPEAVREIDEPGATSSSVGTPYIDVSSSPLS